MNKRKLVLAVITLLALLAVLLTVTACDNIISLEKAEVVCAVENATYEIGEFNYGDYTLRLTYSDGSEVSLPLTENMLSEYDRLQLKSPGQHTFTVKYENKKADFTVTVTRKQVTDNEEDGTVAPQLIGYSVSYDGKPHTLSVSGDVPQGATVLYPLGNTFTNAGTYPVTATIQANGYETVVLNAVLTIEKGTYVFDNFAICADYGTDDAGEPLEKFYYDGLTHGVTMKGTYPTELGEPKYQIINTDTGETRDGNKATDAGHYHVIATFTGDADNYLTNNLTYECYFEIAKKPISMEVLKAIKFESVTVDYDAKPHRIDIGNVQLPSGISVAYYEKGTQTPFGTRTDVGEYDVVARFQSDNPNLQIIDELTAHLSILPVNYVNVNSLHIGFLDESTELTYDGKAHELKVFGLNKNVTVQKFVWNKTANPADDVEITSLTDVLVNDGTVASYKITAYFNTPTDPNHNPVEPISAELTVSKAAFFTPTFEFESVRASYSENATYSLSCIATSLPVGMTTELSYTMPGKVDAIPGLPTVTCLPYDAANPKQNCGVGVYTCTLSFHYNPDNYVDAPAAVSAETRTLEIAPRTYDAAGIITVKNVRTDYAVGVNQLSLCSFSEALPTWVNAVYLTVATKKGSTEPLFTVTDGGEYDYFFRFSYFNGKEMVTADSKHAELKVVGLPIFDRYYSVTYGSAFTYDGLTACIPTATVADEVIGILSIQCTYTFAEPKSSDFVTVYTGDGDRASLLANKNVAAYAKRAGSHKFVFTVAGANFEPLTVGVTMTVNQKKLDISHANWMVKTDTATFTYDGANHADGYAFVSEPPLNEQELVTVAPKLLTAVTNGENPGTDVGEYTYTLVFTAKDKNYYVEAEDEAYFTYKVKILPLDVTVPATEEYCPAGFFYYTSDGQTRYRFANVASVTGNYTASSPIYETVKTYGIKVDENTYTMPQWTCGILNKAWYSGRNLEMYYNCADTSSDTANREILNDAFGKATVLVLRPDGTTQTFEGLTKHTCDSVDDIPSALCSAISAPRSGDYVVMMILESDNVTFNGSRIVAFRLHVDKLEVTSNNILNKSAAGTFEGFGKDAIPLSNELAVVNGFVGDTLYHENFDGTDGWYAGYLTSNLFSGANDFDKAQIKKESSYILYCDLDGNVLTFDGFHTVFAFDPIGGDQLKRPGDNFAQAGYYYLFIDLGPNVIVKNAVNNSDLHHFVICIKVLPYNVAATDLATLKKDGADTAYTQGTARKYQTDAANVKYKYGENAIPGADAVEGTSAFNGANVYTYERLFDNTKLKLQVLPTLSTQKALLTANITFKLTTVSYAFANGGAALGTVYGYYQNTGLSYQDVQNKVSDLYSTETAKTAGITSVGLYYVFVEAESDNILFNGEKRFVVTVKVDRQNDFTYLYQSHVYDLASDTPFPSETVTWKYGTTYDRALSEENATAIKTTGATKVECGSISGAGAVGKYCVHAKFTFDTDAFGGYTVEGDYPILTIKKLTVNLSNLTPLGAQTFCQASVDGQAVSNSLRDKIKQQFLNMGMAPADAIALASRIFSYNTTTYQPFTDAQGSVTYTKLSDYGEYWFIPSFHLGNNDSLVAKYDIVAGDRYTKSDNTYTPDAIYRCRIFIDRKTDKGRLYLTEGLSATWGSDFAVGEDPSNPIDVVKNTYAFIGFYTETGNDFYNSLLNYMSETQANAWIQSHVKVQLTSSDFLTITIDLGADASKYDFYINSWSYAGTNPVTGKAVGKLISVTKSSETSVTITAKYYTKK